MKRTAIWIEAARPKTLIAGITPVLFGTVCAILKVSINIPLLASILGAALSFQILANLCNDYFDYKQGADTENRKGFRRVTQAGLVTKKQMVRSLLIVSNFATAFSIYPIYKGGSPIILFFIIFLFSAFYYTSGKKSIAYLGLGEVTVFLLFGLLGTNLTYYLLTGTISTESILVSCIPGFLSTALLTMNNIRDVEEDKEAGKKTIAVRFGVHTAKIVYFLCIAFTAAIPSSLVLLTKDHLWTPAANLALLPAIKTIKVLMKFDDPRILNDHFVSTAKMQMLYSLIFCAAYFI
jgi:1,4-dihydroxy-2-naphthoate polyprenyltransferase